MMMICNVSGRGYFSGWFASFIKGADLD
jgi:hypothetical protein